MKDRETCLRETLWITRGGYRKEKREKEGIYNGFYHKGRLLSVWQWYTL